MERAAAIRAQEAWLDEPEAPITREEIWRQAYQPNQQPPQTVPISPYPEQE